MEQLGARCSRVLAEVGEAAALRRLKYSNETLLQHVLVEAHLAPHAAGRGAARGIDEAYGQPGFSEAAADALAMECTFEAWALLEAMGQWERAVADAE